MAHSEATKLKIGIKNTASWKKRMQAHLRKANLEMSVEKVEEKHIFSAPYPVDWTQTLKRSIRERDHYTCQYCGELQGDRAFDVHHIDFDKENCDPNNLVTLCQSCHMKVTKDIMMVLEHLR